MSDYDIWHGDPRRRLPDGRQAIVVELTYGRGRICMGDWDDLGFQITY